MTTVNDIADILRIIREQPEWADALRSALLSQELLELPQRLAEFIKSTNARLESLEADVSDIKEGQARLEGEFAEMKGDFAEMKLSQTRMEGQIGNMRGAFYEQRVAGNIATLARQSLGLRRVRVLKGFAVTETMAFYDLIDSAEDRGAITAQERIDVGSADLIIQGESHPDRATVYVVLEVSVTAADSDITRASDRADVLRRATGQDSVAAIVSANADETREQLAAANNVTLINFRDRHGFVD